jgi:hypothetical protein
MREKLRPLKFKVKIKVEPSLQGLDRTLDIHEVEASRISIHSVHEIGEVVRHTHTGHIYHHEIFLVLIPVRG